jgi:hypothetical protein
MAYRFKPLTFTPRRSVNEENAKTQYVCYICGRDIDAKQDHFMIHAIHGGYEVLHPEDSAAYMATNDTGDLGGQPVGPTCVKKHGLAGWACKVGPLDPAHYTGYGIR